MKRYMLMPFRPMSAGERRRLFLERNPNYDRDRKRRQRAAIEARLAARAAAAVDQPLALPAPPVRLCLPLPGEQLPLFILDERTPEPVPAAASRGEQPLARRAA